MLLVCYSFLGGIIFYAIEAPVEQGQLETKAAFLEAQKNELITTLWDIKERNIPEKDSLLRLKEAVYWYTIAVMYMNGNITKEGIQIGEDFATGRIFIHPGFELCVLLLADVSINLF